MYEARTGRNARERANDLDSGIGGTAFAEALRSASVRGYYRVLDQSWARRRRTSRTTASTTPGLVAALRERVIGFAISRCLSKHISF